MTEHDAAQLRESCPPANLYGSARYDEQRGKESYARMLHSAPNYLRATPNERRRMGDTAADISDFLLCGDPIPSRETYSRTTANGTDDFEEEIIDEVTN